MTRLFSHTQTLERLMQNPGRLRTSGRVQWLPGTWEYPLKVVVSVLIWKRRTQCGWDQNDNLGPPPYCLAPRFSSLSPPRDYFPQLPFNSMWPCEWILDCGCQRRWSVPFQAATVAIGVTFPYTVSHPPISSKMALLRGKKQPDPWVFESQWPRGTTQSTSRNKPSLY